jgi:glycerophosphoryl diester phosphodiesterase
VLAVAHRAGNSLADLKVALDAGVDFVETDVHLYRGAMEVRHLKNLGPYWMWDKWELVRRRNAGLIELGEVLTALGGDPRLMIDLKGVDRDLAPAVAVLLREAVPDAPVALCTKNWWMFDAFAGDDHLRIVPSASNRAALRRLLERLRTRPAYAVSIRQTLLTPAVVEELHENAGLVLSWSVDTREELERARRIGVSGVISKRLDLLREVVASRGSAD